MYKGHVTPVWDVEFSPHGYYFVSGGHDKTARLWVTDQHQPVRVFVGHFADVDVGIRGLCYFCSTDAQRIESQHFRFPVR